MSEWSYVPRYVTIERSLRERIATMQPGDKLPSDAELCEEFGVSRMTARHAVQSLVHNGLVTRIPGRGTFVARPPVRRQMGSLLSFTEEMRRRGLEASSRVLSRSREAPTEAEVAQLGLASGEQVVVVRRLRLANEVPMSIERAALHPALEAVLDEDLEAGSLHQAMTRLGRVPTMAQGTLTSRLAATEEARLLDLSSPAPMLIERRLITDQHGRPIEFTESCYAGERYVFDIELRVESAYAAEADDPRAAADAAVPADAEG